jgi:hypothetical protein
MPTKKKLGAGVTKQLARLKCTLSEPKRIATPHKGDRFVVFEPEGKNEWRLDMSKAWEWDAGKASFDTGSPVFAFLNGVRWKKRDFELQGDDDDPEAIEIITASENMEYRAKKKRHVFYSFAYHPSHQYFYCVDLLDSDADPTVHRVDHDGSSFSDEGALSELLKQLS